MIDFIDGATFLAQPSRKWGLRVVGHREGSGRAKAGWGGSGRDLCLEGICGVDVWLSITGKDTIVRTSILV